MPQIQSVNRIDITPEKFLNACDSTELHEVELLLSKSKYQEKMGRQHNPLMENLKRHKMQIARGSHGRANGLTTTAISIEIRECHQCGCTDDDCRQCIEKTGEPCHWVSENLCSACAENSPLSKES
jgi:hypothetical protein